VARRTQSSNSRTLHFDLPQTFINRFATAYARRCAELAALVASPEEREHFLSLEKAWIRSAAELESAETFLNAMAEIDPDQTYTSDAA
jgi:hypothetical protein